VLLTQQIGIGLLGRNDEFIDICAPLL
jgi:hypothetical protein